MELTSLYTVGIVAGSALALAGFVRVECMSARPMFDCTVFRIPRFSGALMGSIGMNFSYWPFMIYIPIYFQIGLGYDPVTAGLALLAYTVPTLIFPPLGERIVVRYRPGIATPISLFAIGLGFLLMKLGSVASHPSALTMPGCVFAGAGLVESKANAVERRAKSGLLPSGHGAPMDAREMSASSFFADSSPNCNAAS